MQVLAVVHEDLHNTDCLVQLEHTATSILSVSHPRTIGFTTVCHLLHKKSSGKIARVVRLYFFFHTLRFEKIKDSKLVETDIVKVNFHRCTSGIILKFLDRKECVSPMISFKEKSKMKKVINTV